MATKKKKLTEAEIDAAILETLGDIFDNGALKPEDEQKMFERLKAVEEFTDYLTITLSNDAKRYFSANTDEARQQIKGAFARTYYLRAKIRGEKKNLATLKGKRHAS